MTAEPTSDVDQPADWEAFYNDYRKPGFIPGFQITSKLGGGMFGIVFRARRLSIDKDYAIKFLKVDDGDVRRAVLAELEQVKYFAQIDHPNLVSIEDRGEVNGIPYLVMAFAGTETLRDQMPLTEEGIGRPPQAAEKDDLLRFFLQSCRGLQALHERSLVHFDIKPANVFLKGGVARLGDYGLSKLVTHSRGSLSMGRGTPYYMAPEMLQRRGDVRSDIYSLGILLYEILCGQVPFTGDSEWEVLRKHETAAPELPEYLTATERTVLQRCLAKEPEARFESVQELIQGLGAPTSSAAAAWRDVQAGADVAPLSSPPPPPPPPPSPPPSPSSANPYMEMAHASRKVFEHATGAAGTAIRDAGLTAQKVAKDAHEKVRASLGRRFGIGRVHAWMRLRRQKKRARARQRSRDVAKGMADPVDDVSTTEPNVFLRAALVIGVLVLVGLVLVGVMFAGARETRFVQRSSPPVLDQEKLSREAVFVNFVVPDNLLPLVSTEEPTWARYASDKPREAKRLLLATIDKLRRSAPISPSNRINAELPSFEPTPMTLPQERQAIANEISVLLRLKAYDRRFARKIVLRGPVALAMAAETMSSLEFKSADDQQSAVRLHRLLEEATTCRDLKLVTRGSLSDLGKFNRSLGVLWMWFVNEFAHSEYCWYAYRKLLRI